MRSSSAPGMPRSSSAPRRERLPLKRALRAALVVWHTRASATTLATSTAALGGAFRREASQRRAFGGWTAAMAAARQASLLWLRSESQFSAAALATPALAARALSAARRWLRPREARTINTWRTTARLMRERWIGDLGRAVRLGALRDRRHALAAWARAAQEVGARARALRLARQGVLALLARDAMLIFAIRCAREGASRARRKRGVLWRLTRVIGSWRAAASARRHRSERRLKSARQASASVTLSLVRVRRGRAAFQKAAERRRQWAWTLARARALLNRGVLLPVLKRWGLRARERTALTRLRVGTHAAWRVGALGSCLQRMNSCAQAKRALRAAGSGGGVDSERGQWERREGGVAGRGNETQSTPTAPGMDTGREEEQAVGADSGQFAVGTDTQRAVGVGNGRLLTQKLPAQKVAGSPPSPPLRLLAHNARIAQSEGEVKQIRTAAAISAASERWRLRQVANAWMCIEVAALRSAAFAQSASLLSNKSGMHSNPPPPKKKKKKNINININL
ncbi:hypothetical protein T492DRAFT_928120 [Pavlovales sp. CCMP2436]|nr:hypothetical protein T492DRAFT_928120 [Pavlovales sp. CCMP2436]